jgi:hypothetical protein
MNVDIPELEEWVIAGDFDLIKNPSNSFKLGGDLTEINLFNEIIFDLGLVEICFSGRNFTWSNMQSNPLVKLDWVFTSQS